MRRRSRKKPNYFKKFIKFYIVLLIVLMILFLLYVRRSLLTYEDLQVDNFLNKTFSDVVRAGESDKISKYVDLSELELSDFEKNTFTKDKAIAKLLKKADLRFELSSESLDLTNPVYNVYVDGKLMFNVKLNGENKITKLAILTIQDWKIESINFVNSNSFYEYNIEVPSNLKVYVNGIELNENNIVSEDEGLKDLAQYASIPYVINYKVSGLIAEPDVVIKREDGTEVECQKNDNNIVVSVAYEKIENMDDALNKIKGNIDIKKVANDWSLYLTNDLNGTLHGFNEISKYLIKDSYMWKYAYKWATDVDITFISSHRLDNPTFTNEKISNFEIYNENAFSCEVYLEKHLTLTKTGQKLTDKMNERMYFVYHDNGWKLVKMQSVTNNS